jgi:hypothetical protein
MKAVYSRWLHGNFCNSHAPGIFESYQQELVRLAPLGFRHDEVGGVEKKRIDLRGLYEAQDVHGPARSGRDLLDFLRVDEHVGAILLLVALHHFGAFHDPVAVGAEQRLPQARLADAMELVKIDPDRPGSGVQPDRNRHEPERNHSLPCGRCHTAIPPTSGNKCTARRDRYDIQLFPYGDE